MTQAYSRKIKVDKNIQLTSREQRSFGAKGSELADYCLPKRKNRIYSWVNLETEHSGKELDKPMGD